MTGDLYATVMDALAASGLPPQRLELEPPRMHWRTYLRIGAAAE